MNRIDRLLRGWDFSFEKEDWYPPLWDALKGLSADQADWRPDGTEVNTIWEYVHHIIFYKERMLKKWTGEESKFPEGVTNDDTFAVESKSEEDWQQTLARLERVHRTLRDKLAALSDGEPDEAMGGKLEDWADGLIRHDAFHAGEIILLRKMQRSWPSRRSFE